MTGTHPVERGRFFALLVQSCDDGFRCLKRPIRDLGFADHPDVYAWDPTTRSYRATVR